MTAALKILEKYQDWLLSLPNVIGVGIGHKTRSGKSTRETAIVVFVKCKLSSEQLLPASIVPPELDGIVTDVRASGEIHI